MVESYPGHTHLLLVILRFVVIAFHFRRFIFHSFPSSVSVKYNSEGLSFKMLSAPFGSIGKVHVGFHCALIKKR